MSVSPSAFAAIVESSVNARMGAISGYFPLAQKLPKYFIEMTTAIGMGIIQGGPSISFTTADTGFTGVPPVPGIGSGTGIITDSSFFIQDLYTRIRTYVLAEFGRTSHDPYPPGPTNSGRYLLAFCEGIADAFQTYYPTAWTLVSAHPLVYVGSGSINDGMFSGLDAPSIQNDIMSNAPDLIGPFWPKLAQAISESYVALIEQHSTGSVTIVGVCIPSLSQVCGVPGVGVGTGTAS